ncbi:MAG: hypothetical protein ABI840_06100, partial [bacterium]
SCTARLFGVGLEILHSEIIWCRIRNPAQREQDKKSCPASILHSNTAYNIIYKYTSQTSQNSPL